MRNSICNNGSKKKNFVPQISKVVCEKLLFLEDGGSRRQVLGSLSKFPRGRGGRCGVEGERFGHAVLRALPLSEIVRKQKGRAVLESIAFIWAIATWLVLIDCPQELCNEQMYSPTLSIWTRRITRVNLLKLRACMNKF